MEKVMLKISGEALKGSLDNGIDPVILDNIASQIKEASQMASISIVLGGGNFFRGRDAEALSLDRVDLDYMGMLGTVLNSLALKSVLKSKGVDVVLFSSLEVSSIDVYFEDDAINALNDGKVVIFAGGTGRPYYSTDTAALLKAANIGVTRVIMGKIGVDGVYDSDPRVNKDAKKYDILSHKDLIENNLGVMDLSAAVIADTNDIDIFVFSIEEEDAIIKAVKGEISHTLITRRG